MTNNVQKVIVWVIPEKSRIQFKGDNDPFAISANVMEKYNFEKYPLVAGDTVSVGIEDNEVTFLRKVKGTTSKKTETTNTPSSLVQKVVEKINPKYTGVKFVGENIYYNYKNVTNKDEFGKTIVAGQTVNIEFKTRPNKNDASKLIYELTKIEVAKTETPTTNLPTNTEELVKNDKDLFYRCKRLENQVEYLQNEKQASIESQAAVNSACEVVSKLKPKGLSEINNIIKEIATSNYNLIQQLKGKAKGE